MLILSAFLIVVGFVTEQTFLGKPILNNGPTIGEKVPLSSEYFQSTQKSVILVLQTTCSFCNASMPFYKRLVDRSKGKDINYVAVFPESTEEGSSHLSKYGIIGMIVSQAEIETLRVSGTPTLIITNDQGIIEKVWIGRLSPQQELEVFDGLNL